ncbi:MAG: hypothetical protein HBSIN02_00190 [Bacteroidia bacterium]|nr:MAG: hypothetical protein HBSIN02_00190 [Bacteroidia bacterium]
MDNIGTSAGFEGNLSGQAGGPCPRAACIVFRAYTGFESPSEIDYPAPLTSRMARMNRLCLESRLEAGRQVMPTHGPHALKTMFPADGQGSDLV